ncbi:flagellar protein [Thermococcus sp.]
MGFSVSASAAILFTSILLMASTLYITWENTYYQIMDAKSYWYKIRESQLHFNAKISSLAAVGTDLQVNFTYLGTPIDGVFDVIFDGTYNQTVASYPYLIPNVEYSYVISGGTSDTLTHNVVQAFANGCVLKFQYQYNGTTVNLLSQSVYCPGVD